MRETELRKILHQNNLEDKRIEEVISSGYFIHSYHNFSNKISNMITDKFYGTKGTSSVFEPLEFIKYVKNEEHKFTQLQIIRHTVKSFEDIQDILAESPVINLIESGRMSFRGQSKNHYASRKIPNPLRKNKFGKELTIMPGIFRNKPLSETRFNEFFGKSSIAPFLRFLEPTNPDIFQISQYSYDMMRVEQHYATNTAGLDITFDIRSAIYFATHKYESEGGRATYKKIPRGAHEGSIYLFRFLDPPVKKTEFYVRDFDLFKTYTPERILRQHCGLPLFSEYERNIAVTDLHCIIDLHEDFQYEEGFDYNFMFPTVEEDCFYKELLKLKAKYPSDLKDIVEYY